MGPGVSGSSAGCGHRWVEVQVWVNTKDHCALNCIKTMV